LFYSLRSLMIVVTLVCVVLGGVMGRVEYLRRWAVFHDGKQASHLVQWRQEHESLDKGLSSAAEEARKRGLYFHHKTLADQYRKVTNRPWTVVNEVPQEAP
jgi:hypothetical protein